MKKNKDCVLFYSLGGPYSEFSNWYMIQFELDGERWESSEHYYMAQKTLNEKEKVLIKNAKDAAEAKRLGRKVRLRPNWDDIKFNIMYKACYAKFSQNEELKELLLSTGDLPIHEDCKDPWWGGGPNFPNGRDFLGKVLKKVRSDLRDIVKEV